MVMIKKLSIALAALLPVLCPAQSPSFRSFDRTQFSTNNLQILELYGTNLLTIDPNGSDTLALTNPHQCYWKSAYNLNYYPTSSWTSAAAYGAITMANAGDWIVFNSGTYFVPSIPLQYVGNGAGPGLNLWIKKGAILIHSNPAATNVIGNFTLAWNETGIGGMIIPGNGSLIVIDGICIATNQGGGFDAVVGWNGTSVSGRGFVGAGTKNFNGITNWNPTSFYVSGSGILDPPWMITTPTNVDVIYCLPDNGSVTAGNTNITRAEINGGAGLILYSVWDTFAMLNGGSFPAGGTNGNLITRNLNTFSYGSSSATSIGISIGGPWNWQDYDSTFQSTNSAVSGGTGLLSTFTQTNQLFGTRFVILGGGIPFTTTSGGVIGGFFTYSDGFRSTNYVLNSATPVSAISSFSHLP